MSDTADLVVIGAGAAGLATAIFAKEEGPELSVVLLEGAKKVGAKILISGGGRCNVTHKVVDSSDFQGNQPIIRGLLKSFSEEDAVAWFSSMGVELVEEDTGKLFPTTNSAKTVVAALIARCEELEVDIRTEHRVSALSQDSGSWTIEHAAGAISARRVVIATGGLALPKSGSDGFGLDFAEQRGHEVTALWPALVPLTLEESFPHAELSGIAHEVELSTRVNGKIIDRRTGALLWTHTGISGPVAMDASRFWVGARHEQKEAGLFACILPGEDRESVEEIFLEVTREEPKRNVMSLLSPPLPRRVVEVCLGLAGIEGNPALSQVKKESRKALVRALTELELPVSGDRGWSYAEVTAGGVSLAEIDRRNMESRKQPGLHFVGEVLDCEGRIGGFNFQWAWSTGHQAGRAIARALSGD